MDLLPHMRARLPLTDCWLAIPDVTIILPSRPQWALWKNTKPEDYARLCASAIKEEAEKLGLPLPKLRLEPGRTPSGPAGVAVGKVGAARGNTSYEAIVADQNIVNDGGVYQGIF